MPPAGRASPGLVSQSNVMAPVSGLLMNSPSIPSSCRAATLLLSQGVPLKVVQEALGHATIAVTADVYGHLLPELQKDAARRMDDALRGAV